MPARSPRLRIHDMLESIRGIEKAIAGYAIGTAAGWLMHRNSDTPYTLRIMPHGIYVGIDKKF